MTIYSAASVSTSGPTEAYAAVITASGSDQRAEINQALQDVKIGETVLLKPATDGGPHEISGGPIVIDRAVNLKGVGANTLYGSIDTNWQTINFPLVSPYVVGSVIRQNTAAQNAINVSVRGLSVNLGDFGIKFAEAIKFANTGHGVYCVPPTLTGGGGDNSLYGAAWNPIVVYGHDGNHYGFVVENAMMCRFLGLHSLGGGGAIFRVNSVQGNYGGLHIDQFFAEVVVAGTAHGLDIYGSNTSGLIGLLNMLHFNACQSGVFDLGAALGVSPPTSAQKPLNGATDGSLSNVTFTAANFEASNTIGSNNQYPVPNGLFGGVTIDQASNMNGGFPVFQHKNRTMKEDLSFYGTAQGGGGDGKGLWGFYNTTTGEQFGIDTDNAVRNPVKGLAIRSTVPRPAAHGNAGAVLLDAVTSAIVISDDTNWSDVAAAPTIAALSDIANLALQINVHGLGLANAAAVSTATDSSGGGNNFTASGSARPAYSTSVVTRNGRNSMYFDGTNTVMSASLAANPGAFTDFYIVKPDDAAYPAADARAMLGATSGGAEALIGTNGDLTLNKALTSVIGNAANSVTPQTWALCVVRYDGTNLKFRVDSSDMGTAAVTPTALSASTAMLGANGSGQHKFKGWMNYIVRYHRALTDTEVMSVEKLLRAFSGTN